MKRSVCLPPLGSISAMLACALAAVFAARVVAASSSPGGIEESRFVTIGGIEQFVTIRGADRRRPVLLFLHGGPGDTQSQFPKTYEALERDFVVVQWDQRGAGRTRARATEQTRPASLDLLTSDGIELTQYLQSYLHSKKVVLVGHSWGSFLGANIVKQRPDLFRAFIGTGLVVSWKETVAGEYRYTLERSRQAKDITATEELEALGVPASDNFDQYLTMRRRLNQYLAPADVRWLSAQDEMLNHALSGNDLKAYWEGLQTMTGLSATVFSINLPSIGYRFRLPFFIIDGGDDHIAPTPLARSYFQRVQAPRKQMMTIAGAGHFAAMTHTSEFASDVRALLRQGTD